MKVQSFRHSYDTLLISMYMHGKEHLVPEHVRQQIPSSTAAGFRSRDPDHYIGSDLRHLQQEMLGHHEMMLNHKNLRRVLRTVTRVWLTFVRMGAGALLKKKEFQEWVVEQVQELSTTMPKRTAMKVLGISPSAFAYALDRLRHRCGISPLMLCRKRNPLQLSMSEVRKIKALMTDPDLTCWPALSIYLYARKNNLLLIGQSTFYRYLNLMGYSMIRKVPRLKKHPISSYMWTPPSGSCATG